MNQPNTTQNFEWRGWGNRTQRNLSNHQTKKKKTDPMHQFELAFRLVGEMNTLILRLQIYYFGTFQISHSLM